MAVRLWYMESGTNAIAWGGIDPVSHGSDVVPFHATEVDQDEKPHTEYKILGLCGLQGRITQRNASTFPSSLTKSGAFQVGLISITVSPPPPAA